MIRFRFVEDEKRFVRLHSELFERIARAGLREGAGSEALRNVGKIETMAFMEGLRQGLAMAWIARQMVEEEVPLIPQPLEQKAFQLHALLYGSSDTPLRSVEKEWLKKLGLDEGHMAKSWLDDKPMRFAPATLQELEGVAPPVAPMQSVRAASKPRPVAPVGLPPDPISAPDDSGDDAIDAPASIPVSCAFGEHRYATRQTTGKETCIDCFEEQPEGPEESYEPDEDVEALIARVEARGEFVDDNADVQPESPEFLDLAREAMQVMKRGGWDPKTWNEVILGLHRQMGVDAGFLDLQLTTHVGRAVLEQCGLVGIAPPEMMDFAFLDAPTQVPGRPSVPLIGDATDEDDNVEND